jgi:hypothetical protein
MGASRCSPRESPSHRVRDMEVESVTAENGGSAGTGNWSKQQRLTIFTRRRKAVWSRSGRRDSDCRPSPWTWRWNRRRRCYRGSANSGKLEQQQRLDIQGRRKQYGASSDPAISMMRIVPDATKIASEDQETVVPAIPEPGAQRPDYPRKKVHGADHESRE